MGCGVTCGGMTWESSLGRFSCVLLCLDVELCLSVALLGDCGWWCFICILLSGGAILVCGVGLLLIFVPGGCGLALLRATLLPFPLGAPLSD